jgi:competence CoiA-like predicted nuclease
MKLFCPHCDEDLTNEMIKQGAYQTVCGLEAETITCPACDKNIEVRVGYKLSKVPPSPVDDEPLQSSDQTPKK